MIKQTFSHRDFLVAMGAAFFLLGSVSPPHAFAADSRQNVLFIGIDDLNDWIGCLGGNPDVKTPHIDRLAARGVLFTIAHCATPACNPSRAALTTHGKDNHSLRSERWRYVRYSDATEELYDHRKDTLEWQNIASDPQYHEIKGQLAKWLPKINVAEIPKKTAKAEQKQRKKK